MVVHNRMQSARWDLISVATQCVLGPLVVLYLTQKAIDRWGLSSYWWLLGAILAIVILILSIKQLQRMMEP